MQAPPAAQRIPTPREIRKGLDEYVIGQSNVKVALSVGVYNHYKRISVVEAQAANEARREAAGVQEEYNFVQQQQDSNGDNDSELSDLGLTQFGKSKSGSATQSSINSPDVSSIADANFANQVEDCEIDKSNLMPTTFIVFSADHGLAMGRHGLLGKQNLYEHSMRVPMIVAGPGVAANLRVQTLVYVADLFPTLLDLGGLVDSNSSSGSLNATLAASPFKSLRPCMLPVHATAKPHACASPHHVIVTAFATLARAITTQRWKLICYPPSARVQLFDLRKDPLEMHDLGADAEHAPLRVSLLLELVRTFRGMVPPVPNPRASHVNCSHQTASHLCLYPVERMNFPTHFARLNDTIMCPLHHTGGVRGLLTLTGESWREYYGGSAQYVQ